MYELPLFPLNSVLFPGTPINLHIFEERYKRMIGTCIQERQPFGVALIRQGAERSSTPPASGPLAEPHRVGCSAQIIQVTRLEQGRMNIVAVGQERFRILSLDNQSAPYLVGTVEPYALEIVDPFEMERQAKLLHAAITRMVEKLSGAGGSGFDLSQLPEDPVALAYMAVAVLQTGLGQKQALLELNEANLLLESVRALYRRELALLDAVLKHGENEQGGSGRVLPGIELRSIFSKN